MIVATKFDDTAATITTYPREKGYNSLYHFILGFARAKGEKKMNGKQNNGTVMTEERYREAIIELVRKVNPECLKRMLSLVSYLYVWK